MRSHPIYCDWCRELITERLIVYMTKLLIPHATFEGAQDTFDFCSDDHLTAWKDHAAMTRLKAALTSRMGGPDEATADTYRRQLADEIATRVSAAMERPQVAAMREP